MSDPFVTSDDNGTIILVDDDALSIIRSVSKYNCENTFNQNRDRIDHFKRRIEEKDLSNKDVVIVIISVDDPNGKVLADHLMPNHDWDPIRNQGMIPFARGLAGREGIQIFLDFVDKEAAEKLKSIQEKIAVIVVDHQVAEIFSV